MLLVPYGWKDVINNNSLETSRKKVITVMPFAI